MADPSTLQLQTGDDSKSTVPFSLLYPIIGSVVVSVIIISIAAFILSHRPCRKKRTDNDDTESKRLQEKLAADKDKMAQSSLVYDIVNGRPIYSASVSQQEHNEIAEEVRETYKSIASSDGAATVNCCSESACHHGHHLCATSPDQPKFVKVGKNTDVKPDSLLITSGIVKKTLQDHSNSSKSESLPNKLQRSAVASDLLIAKESSSAIPSCEESPRIQPTSQEIGEVKNLLLSKWIQERREEEEGENFESSFKTNNDLNYTEVDSILTSVSRMNPRRFNQLKDTSFYKTLKLHTPDGRLCTKLDSPQYSESTDTESLEEDSLETEYRHINHSFSQEEIFSLESSQNISNDGVNEILMNSNQIPLSSPLPRNPLQQKGYKRPIQYVDKESESFFKIVRPAPNPEGLSESSRTRTELFKCSERIHENSNSSRTSPNTYSYDKHAQFMIIDDDSNDEEEDLQRLSRFGYEQSNNTKDSTQTDTLTTTYLEQPSTISDDTTTSTNNSENRASFRPYELALENKLNDLSIDMSITTVDDYDKREYFDDGNTCNKMMADGAMLMSRDFTPSKDDTITYDSEVEDTKERHISQTQISKKVSHQCSASSLLSNSSTDTTTETSGSDAWSCDSDSGSSGHSISKGNHQERQKEKKLRLQENSTQIRTKTKTVRGNLSAYISSRQSATLTKEQSRKIQCITAKGYTKPTATNKHRNRSPKHMN